MLTQQKQRSYVHVSPRKTNENHFCADVFLQFSSIVLPHKEDTRINFRLYTLVFFSSSSYYYFFLFFSGETTPRYLFNDAFTRVLNIFSLTFRQWWLLNWENLSRGGVYLSTSWNTRVISSIIGLWRMDFKVSNKSC